MQRPLWASTGTKNKAYSDIMYIQELIGPDTVNTMPPATIDAFRDHGVVRRTIDEGVDEAHAVMRRPRCQPASRSTRSRTSSSVTASRRFRSRSKQITDDNDREGRQAPAKAGAA